MIIFEQERLDGIEHLVSSTGSVKLSSLAEPLKDKNLHISLPKAVASYDDTDLYYIQSILVSSSWNKNDDIFDKREIWLARSTPEDKPTNLEHDESVIVGHITSNWPITEDGQMIDPNTDIDSLPDKYHILTGSVIYKGYSNSELRSRAEKLIEEIENGTKYVSMECFFKGFDYGVLDKTTGEYKVLPRNNDTAYLTKHLRAYGGQGEKDNYKIGRVLRDITFTGKGFVDKPANEDSVIFTKESFFATESQKNNEISTKKTNEFSFSGVSNKQSQLYSEANDMSKEVENSTSPCDEIISKASNLMDKVSELTEQNLNLTSQIDNINKEHEVAMSQMQENNSAELAKAEQALMDRITQLETEVQKYVELEAEAAKKMKDMEEEKKMMKEKEEKMQADILAANEVIAGYKTKEEEMMKKEKKMKRQAALLECGVDTDTAASVLEQFEALDDAAFDAMTAVFATLKPATVTEEAVSSTTEAEETTTVTEQVLETVEVDEEVNLGVGSEAVTEENSTTAALVEFVRSRLSKK